MLISVLVTRKNPNWRNSVLDTAAMRLRSGKNTGGRKNLNFEIVFKNFRAGWRNWKDYILGAPRRPVVHAPNQPWGFNIRVIKDRIRIVSWWRESTEREFSRND